jgi:hypothetical protein
VDPFIRPGGALHATPLYPQPACLSLLLPQFPGWTAHVYGWEGWPTHRNFKQHSKRFMGYLKVRAAAGAACVCCRQCAWPPPRSLPVPRSRGMRSTCSSDCGRPSQAVAAPLRPLPAPRCAAAQDDDKDFLDEWGVFRWVRGRAGRRPRHAMQCSVESESEV